MNIFENNNGIVVRDHLGEEHYLGEGADIGIKISKTDNNDPERQPTVIAVQTDSAEEAAKIINAHGIDKMTGEEDSLLITPKEPIMDVDQDQEAQDYDETLARMLKLAGLDPSAAPHKNDTAVVTETDEEDAPEEEAEDDVDAAINDAYEKFDGGKIDEAAIDRIRKRVQLRNKAQPCCDDEVDEDTGEMSPITDTPDVNGPEALMGKEVELTDSAFGDHDTTTRKDPKERIRQMVLNNLSFLNELRQEGDDAYQIAKELIAHELENGECPCDDEEYSVVIDEPTIEIELEDDIEEVGCGDDVEVDDAEDEDDPITIRLEALRNRLSK